VHREGRNEIVYDASPAWQRLNFRPHVVYDMMNICLSHRIIILAKTQHYRAVVFSFSIRSACLTYLYSGSVGKDFVYHACGHEFESRLK